MGLLKLEEIMKRLLIILFSAICCISAKGQDLYDQCSNEVDAIFYEADKIWYNNGVSYEYTPERQYRYAEYCITASNVIDGYLKNVTSTRDKIDLLWFQLRVLSPFLYNEDGPAYNGMQISEFNHQVSKFVSIVDQLSEYSNTIPNKYERDLERAYIAQNLGYLYFYQKKYKEAKEQFNIIVSTCSLLASNTDYADEAKALIQCGYYELGHIAYKLGDVATANNYYSKAKSIKSTLNNMDIVPYR